MHSATLTLLLALAGYEVLDIATNPLGLPRLDSAEAEGLATPADTGDNAGQAGNRYRGKSGPKATTYVDPCKPKGWYY